MFKAVSIDAKVSCSGTSCSALNYTDQKRKVLRWTVSIAGRNLPLNPFWAGRTSHPTLLFAVPRFIAALPVIEPEPKPGSTACDSSQHANGNNPVHGGPSAIDEPRKNESGSYVIKVAGDFAVLDIHASVISKVPKIRKTKVP